MKYRLMVVEDDNNIRNGLIKIIDNMKLPLEEISSASNGTEALALADRIRPHIIITDIKMPAMNGLDFIERVIEMDPQIKTIIISGYSEFSYAQRAIRFNVSDYLLKPVKKDKLKSVLDKVIEEIMAKQRDKEQKAINDNRVKEYHRMLMKEILEGYHSSSDIDYVLSNAGIQFKKSGFMVYSVYCKTTGDLLWKFLDEASGELFIVFKYLNRYNHIICLVNTDLDESSLACGELSRKIKSYSEENMVSVYAGASEWKGSINQLTELVRQAEKALDVRLLTEKSQVFYYSNIRKHSGYKSALNVYFDEIKNAANHCNMAGIEAGTDRLFDFLLNKCQITPSLLKNSIAGYILYYMSPDKQDLILKSINEIEDIYQMSDTVNDFRIQVKQMLKKLSRSAMDENEKLYGNKIDAAIKYIEENYNQDIYLETVANHVKANASYFSNTFKRETGVYFSDYLQKIRIERAKALLMEPAYKIYEIAEMTGFLDEKYFYKVFKKITGVTPTQYRNGILTPEEDRK